MKLVVEEKIKTVENSGDENLISTTETVSDVEDIITKESLLKAKNEINLNNETFLAKVESEPGIYKFIYNQEEEKWFDEDDNEIDLAEYGITINESEVNDLDEMVFWVEDDGGIYPEYFTHYKIIDGEFKAFDFVADSSVKLRIVIDDQEINFFQATKAQFNFGNSIANIAIDIWSSQTKYFKIKLVAVK